MQPKRNDVAFRVRALSFFALILWLCSLALPSIGARGGPTLNGYDVLVQGFAGIRYGVFAWFANPLLLFGLGAAIAGRRRSALVLSLIALLVAGSSYWTAELAALWERQVPELSFLPGFYCWIGAHVAAVGGGIIGVRETARRAVQ